MLYRDFLLGLLYCPSSTPTSPDGKCDDCSFRSCWLGYSKSKLLKLILQAGSKPKCLGVDTLINTKTLEVIRFISKVLLLASGGVGHIYPSMTNPQASNNSTVLIPCKRSEEDLVLAG
ncbi:hypothetical protein I3842_03G123000 [Carya illinoinensis]|uniref:Uncharacterized protein n=1 Tax=Carya illinoinensis TaxID=32201 RepID=A0A922JVD1_CARIL|nr:hypothetical protein I3842_03G123000 [Carya illinoinensis]